MLHSHAPVQTLTEMNTNFDTPPNSEKPVAASSRNGAEKQPQKLTVVEPLISPKLVDVNMIGLLGGVKRSSVYPPSQELYSYSFGVTDNYFRKCYVCRKKFQLQVNLFIHYKNIHHMLWRCKENRRFQCLLKGAADRSKKTCLRHFTNVNEMRDHQKLVHPDENDRLLEDREALY